MYIHICICIDLARAIHVCTARALLVYLGSIAAADSQLEGNVGKGLHLRPSLLLTYKILHRKRVAVQNFLAIKFTARMLCCYSQISCCVVKFIARILLIGSLFL